jgi:hypothetical protein
MDLKRVVEKRRELETNINNLIELFEKQTKVPIITDINMNRSYIFNDFGNPSEIVVSLTIPD